MKCCNSVLCLLAVFIITCIIPSAVYAQEPGNNGSVDQMMLRGNYEEALRQADLEIGVFYEE